MNHKYFFLLASSYLIVSLMALVSSLANQPKFEVSFLNVGQGDSTLISSLGNIDLLVDAGPGRETMRALSGELSFFDRHIDVVVITHPDTDHINGLPEIMERYKVGMIIEPGISSDNPAFLEIKRQAEEKGVAWVVGKAGLVIDLGNGARAHILSPERNIPNIETNAGSIVLKIVYEDSSILLTGDIPQSVEKYLVNKYGNFLDVDILKLGHHGSRTSTSDELVRITSPKFGIVSAGKDNKFGHPHKEVINLLASINVPMIGTYASGTVRFEEETGGKLILK